MKTAQRAGGSITNYELRITNYFNLTPALTFVKVSPLQTHGEGLGVRFCTLLNPRS